MQIADSISPMVSVETEAAIKPIASSTTLPHDIETPDDARCIYACLSRMVEEAENLQSNP
jgi:hypothetical protein